MSRTAIALVSGLIVLGCVVAWLPAQESSRRTASKYRPATPNQTTERSSLTPPAPFTPDLAPIVTSRSNLPGADAAGGGSPGGIRNQYVPAGEPADNAGPPGIGGATSSGLNIQSSNADEPAPAASNDDDSQLRSVLKRGKTSAAPEAPAPLAPPPTSPMPVGGSSAGDLPRRPIPTAPSTAPSTAASAPSVQPKASSSFSLETSRSIQNLTIGSKSAALKVEVSGPQGVTVGKPAPYVITLNNESDVPADDVQLRIALPSWVAVHGTQPTSGEAAFHGEAQGTGKLVWALPRVAPRARETLRLHLVTREGEGFDLSVEWTARPAVARAAIVVKQPQLALSLAGPSDMTFGEEKTFTLSVSNPGNGDAEHVMVSVAAGNSPPQQFDAGTIPAGHKKEVPLAVVASQAGTIELSISAAAESGLEARTSGKINVKKAEVSLAIEGPPLKFAGSEAVYRVTVANGGSAAADNINLSLALPSGSKYLGGVDGAQAAAGGLKWKISSLAPGAERMYEVRLQLSAPGLNRVVVKSQATASGTANSAAETEVEAVSDLKLVVNDPSGPLPTGEQAVYELQVMNRGSQAARQVKIIMQFSDGVEPVAFEGCEARIVPGQVLCQPLAQLGPGEQATLRVKAKAQQAGTHHFRVEVTTTDGDARLVSEGTTRFFTDAGRGGTASTARKPSLLPGPTAPAALR